MLDPHLNLFFRYGGARHRDEGGSLSDLEDNVTRAFVTSLSCLGNQTAVQVIQYLFAVRGHSGWLPPNLEATRSSLHLHRDLADVMERPTPKRSLLCIYSREVDASVDADNRGVHQDSILDALFHWNDQLTVGVETKLGADPDRKQERRHLAGLGIKGVEPDCESSPHLVRVTWADVLRAFEDVATSHKDECGRVIARHFCQYLALLELVPEVFDPGIFNFHMEEMRMEEKRIEEMPSAPATTRRLRDLQRGFQGQFEALARRLLDAGLPLQGTGDGTGKAGSYARRSSSEGKVGFSIRIGAKGMPVCEWNSTLWPGENANEGLSVSLYTERTGVLPPFSEERSDGKVRGYRLKASTLQEWDARFIQARDMLRSKASELVAELLRRVDTVHRLVPEMAFSLRVGQLEMPMEMNTWRSAKPVDKGHPSWTTEQRESWDRLLRDAISDRFTWPDFPGDLLSRQDRYFSLADYQAWRTRVGPITKPKMSLWAELPPRFLTDRPEFFDQIAQMMKLLALGEST